MRQVRNLSIALRQAKPAVFAGVWQLDQRRLEDARRCLDMISKQWDDALLRLRRFVEDRQGEG